MFGVCFLVRDCFVDFVICYLLLMWDFLGLLWRMGFSFRVTANLLVFQLCLDLS